MNGSWHDDLENAATIDEAVAFVRNYLGTLPAHELPRYCQPARIKYDADVDDLTYRLAQARRQPPPAPCNAELLGDVFDFFVHASLRISQINRKAASGLFFFPARRAGQMG